MLAKMPEEFKKHYPTTRVILDCTEIFAETPWAISDREITRCSGILDLVEAGDSLMASKVFDIEDLLRGKSVRLNLLFWRAEASFLQLRFSGPK